MADDGETGVICLRVVDANQPLPTSVVQWCELCAEEIWVAQSSLRYLEGHPGAHVYCVQCMDGVAATQSELNIEAMPSGERTNDPRYQEMVRAAQERWQK